MAKINLCPNIESYILSEVLPDIREEAFFIERLKIRSVSFKDV